MYTEGKLQLNFYHLPKSGFKGFVTIEENKGSLKKLYLAIYVNMVQGTQFHCGLQYSS